MEASYHFFARNSSHSHTAVATLWRKTSPYSRRVLVEADEGGPGLVGVNGGGHEAGEGGDKGAEVNFEVHPALLFRHPPACTLLS